MSKCLFARWAVVSAALVVSVACEAASVYDSLSGSGDVNRSSLSYDTLVNASSTTLVDFSAFAVPAQAANPSHEFSGTLTLSNLEKTGSFAEVKTGLQSSYKNPGRLPAFSYQLVQVGTHIFPVRRGLLVTSHPDYEYILEPGRVWQEDADKGYSRAALPFSLQQKQANCTHQGVMSFLFKTDGSISKVSYQIASETCQYFQFNMWGLASATYAPEDIKNKALLIDSYKDEVASRMPTRPIAQLAKDYPDAGLDVSKIGSDQTSYYTTLFGVAIDGVNYVGGCQTRYGSYPYCEVLDLPSYSIAKSVVGGFGLMRLEKKYPGSKDLSLQSQVSECAGKQWADVTLLHALDMATGNYSSSEYEADEGSTGMLNGFFLQNTGPARAKFSCAYRRKSTPGTSWVYHSTDTFLLGMAMNKIYKEKEGSTKDFYTDMLVPEIFKPLKMSPTSFTTVRTADAGAHPFTGYGLTFHHDDLVKLGEFMNKGNASINGVEMLDDTMYREVMQKSDNKGLSIGFPSGAYLHGFWLWNAASVKKDGLPPICSKPKWVPYMSGFGGIGVVLLPNNMVYYYVSDHHEYGFKRTLLELNKIRSLCL